MLRPVLLAAALALAPGLASAAVPDVVVSIKPLHSLAASVMADVGEPALLVGGNASLHSFSLKPSQAEALQEAELVLWVGPSLEGALGDPIDSLANGALVIEVAELPSVVLLPPREGGAWVEEHKDHGHEGIDGHLFLDPVNALVIAEALVSALTALDPENAATYAANGAALRAELEALDTELAAALAPLRQRPFVVFHDAYQYFERRYALTAAGSLTVSPDQQPGARRLRELQERIEALGARCVFAEPGFEPALLETLTEGSDLRTGVLDPEGLTLPPGPALYEELLRGLAKSLKSCLAP